MGVFVKIFGEIDICGKIFWTLCHFFIVCRSI